jgi:hypothetical protein
MLCHARRPPYPRARRGARRCRHRLSPHRLSPHRLSPLRLSSFNVCRPLLAWCRLSWHDASTRDTGCVTSRGATLPHLTGVRAALSRGHRLHLAGIGDPPRGQSHTQQDPRRASTRTRSRPAPCSHARARRCRCVATSLHYAMLCYAMLCMLDVLTLQTSPTWYAMLCYAMRYAMLCYAMLRRLHQRALFRAAAAVRAHDDARPGGAHGVGLQVTILGRCHARRHAPHTPAPRQPSHAVFRFAGRAAPLSGTTSFAASCCAVLCFALLCYAMLC